MKTTNKFMSIAPTVVSQLEWQKAVAEVRLKDKATMPAYDAMHLMIATRWAPVIVLTAALSALLPGSAIGVPVTDTHQQQEALRRALSLVRLDSDLTARLIDPELAPDADAIRRLDAFVVREPDGSLRRTIYINRESAIVQRAAEGSDLHVAVLAAIIHHEVHHLHGASESEARRAEWEFFQSLVARGQVAFDTGWDYLQLLAQSNGRHDLSRGGR